MKPKSIHILQNLLLSIRTKQKNSRMRFHASETQSKWGGKKKSKSKILSKHFKPLNFLKAKSESQSCYQIL